MKKNLSLFLLILILICCSKPDFKELQSELDDNFDKWMSYQGLDYEFEYQKICYCLMPGTFPVIISISSNRVNRVSINSNWANETFGVKGFPSSNFIYSNTLVIKSEYYELYLSITSLFNTIQTFIVEEVDRIAVEYNPDYGYPEYVKVDIDKDMIDDEISFECKKLLFN